MTRLSYLEQYGLTGMKLGIIDVDHIFKYDRYKTYLEFLEKGHPVGQAKLLTADHCRVDRSTIARTIYWFESVQ